MPLDYSSPVVINFLKENYVKEQDRRTVWFQKHLPEIIATATFTEKHKDLRTEHIRRAEVEPYMKDLMANQIVSARNRRKKPIRDGPIIGISEMTKDIKLEPITNAKPVEPEVRNILYEPLPMGGRKQYLNVRKRTIPEDKYDNFETHNHVIGWRLKDSENKPQVPKFGRYASYVHDVLSRSGPQPDPPYYTEPQKGIKTLCKM